jgi:large subunit ribosomal protein L25
VAENALSVELRERAGKGVARKLRAAGRIPGVLYGKKLATLPISLDPRALTRLLATSESGMNTLIHLGGSQEIEGKVVLVRELQRDPVRGNPLHADLFEVDLERSIEVSVPIHLTGRAKGVEFSGGILDQALRELELSCLPTAIPREISIDVGELDIGDSLHVRDLVLPVGVTLVSAADLSVVSVVAPTVEEAPVVEEAAAAIEGEEPEGEGAAVEEKGAAEDKPDEKGGD